MYTVNVDRVPHYPLLSAPHSTSQVVLLLPVQPFFFNVLAHLCWSRVLGRGHSLDYGQLDHYLHL